VAANPGVVPRPETLWLELRESEPRTAPRVVTETTVEAIIEDSPARAVVIRFGWREGFSIPVVTAALPDGRRRPRRASPAAKGRLAASAV
jgi:hypothetical protein